MRSIWKQRLEPISQTQTLRWPQGARVVKVTMQDGCITLWADVETRVLSVPHNYVVRDTGHEVPKGGIYISTCFHGPFVWHVFEIAENE